MKIILKHYLIIFILGVFFSSSLQAQEAVKPRLSPLEMATVKYENTYVKVTYGRPHKRNRVIFGELVPFGEVWRTGANEATEITFTGDVKVAGKKLKAGTYTIFTIPEKENWTIIFNSDLGQWGAYNYNPEKNILEFTVPVGTTDVMYEPFTIEFQLHDNKTDLLMMWENTKVSFPIEFLD